MPYQPALNELLKDVNLYEFGVVLNHADNSSLNELCSNLEAALDNGSLSEENKQILPVFAIANLKVLIDAITSLPNGELSQAQKAALKNACALAEASPENFNEVLKEVESLRQEP